MVFDAALGMDTARFVDEEKSRSREVNECIGMEIRRE